MYDEVEAQLIFDSHPLSTTRSAGIFDSSPCRSNMTLLNLIQTLLLHCCPRIYLSRSGLLPVLVLFAEGAGPLQNYVMYPAQRFTARSSCSLAVIRRVAEPLWFYPRLGNTAAYASDPNGYATSAERKVYSGKLRIHLGRYPGEHSRYQRPGKL